MGALFHDFKHCAQVYAETIVNELYLDDKSLKPVAWEEVDQLNIEQTMLQRPRGLLTHDSRKKRPKWIVSNIRFKIALDENGVYNGNTGKKCIHTHTHTSVLEKKMDDPSTCANFLQK